MKRLRESVATNAFLDAFAQEPSLLCQVMHSLVATPKSVVAFYDYLCVEAQHLPWLVTLLMSRDFQNIWFLCYKTKRAWELLFACEYDYIVRHPSTAALAHCGPHSLSVQMEREIGTVFHGISYWEFIRLAAKGATGRDLYGPHTTQPVRIGDMVSHFKCGDFCLKPAMLPSQWLVFHVKMRRIAVLLIKEIAAMTTLYYVQQGLQPEWVTPGDNGDVAVYHAGSDGVGALIGWLNAYAIFLSVAGYNDHTKDVNDYERIKKFFCSSLAREKIQEIAHDHGLSGLPLVQPQWWRDTLERLVSRVDAELPFPNDTPFVDHFGPTESERSRLQIEPGRYDFMYEPTPEMQQVFHHRVRVCVANDKAGSIWC